MFNPDLRNVLKNRTSRYSLVTAIAKRAREISSDAQENGEILNDKPVSIALDEIIAGEFESIDSKEIQNLENLKKENNRTMAKVIPSIVVFLLNTCG